MKTTFKCLLLAGSLSAPLVQAQDIPSAYGRSGLPLTITVFSESISLPTLAKIQKGGIGLKVGTEFYYRNRQSSQTLQTLSLGYYHHPGVQSGLFLGTELGYRKYLGPVYVDAGVGGGVLLIRPVATSYIPDQTGNFRKASPRQIKFMPSVGLGAGYRFQNQAAIFTRYELFGEMPFSQVLLPHQALHLGARMYLKK